MPTSTIPPLSPQVGIGHVHLKVANLDRALAFYRDVLGFNVTQQLGNQAAFLSVGGYHHHIGLNTWESLDGSPPPPDATGLYHLAILYPTRSDLADALRRLIAAKIPLEAPPIMESAKLSTCVIPMETGWSFTGTGLGNGGRRPRRVPWRCLRALSISTTFYEQRTAQTDPR
jgi:hypothetical protein